MRMIEIVRQEISRVGAQYGMPTFERAKLVKIAKRARKQGINPRAAVSRALANKGK